ncbi:tail fiber domain-containing protein [Arcticibacterium luteifluviistationis]|uniref:Peptidase S74 domain-containing protein n=1 Tax=Arcticibacterium luteifluviistationis TaxID=1784714 RepID=A0A2Z4G995_9BACT|nr:tail fiber domain-containing protein [Arcticibacterium luteifluviistationis]AWV97503.1 hypothetical protein DJ013_04705 [Arcticibacterium luteifluviistationis]
MKLKALSIIICALPFGSFAQIQSSTFGSSDGSVTIVPEGIRSAKSDPSSKSSNVALGPFALHSNTTGDNNSANGTFSLYKNTMGQGNTANGAESLYDNISGNENTAFGYQALTSNISGKENTANGANSLFSNTLGSQNTANGYKALNLNIGGRYNVATGSNALYSNTSGNYNTALGHAALYNNITGDFNIAIGWSANNHLSLPGITNSIVIGANAIVDASNKIRLGDSNITAADIQVAWNVTSDRRWKEDIEPLSLGLNFINDLMPVSYHRKSNKNQDIEFGLIAQDLEETLKKYGLTEQQLGLLDKGTDGYYSVRYNDLIATLVKAVQEQQVIIDGQEQVNNEQDIRANKLTARLEKIESLFLEKEMVETESGAKD